MSARTGDSLPSSTTLPEVPTLPPPPGRSGRLAHLDALRGIAAFLVMIQHSVTIIAEHPQAPGWFRFAAQAFNSEYYSPGRTGVVAFFLISGFVVPFSLKQPHALRGFAISRFFRLYPAYWASLLVAVLVLPTLDIKTFSTTQVLANATMVQFVLGQSNVIGAYWTLFIELVFYVMCAAWFVLGVLRSARFQFVAILGLLAIALLGATIRFINPSAPVPVGYVNFIAAMHVGTLARLAWLEGDTLARKLLPVAVGCALVGAIAISWLAYSRSPEVDPWISGITGLYVGYALFFYTLYRQAFVTRLTLFLGGISFSFYLFHGLTLSVARSIAYTWPWEIGGPFIPLFCLCTAIPLATFVFNWIELPSVRLGHALARATRKQAVGTAA